MDFIINATKKGFWGALADVISDGLKEVMGWIIDMMINMSNIDEYVNTNEYLVFIYAIAGSLLVLAVAKEAFKSQAGLGENRSISDLTIRTIAGGVGVYFLPWVLKTTIIPINNALMLVINSVGQEVSAETVKRALTVNLTDVGGWTIILFLVFLIAWLVFGIAAGIRYFELVISILIAPIIATSLVKGNEGVETWFKEVICIVFTQSIHLLVLKILLVVALNVTGLKMLAITIGGVAVALKGPQSLRTYLYTSGVGSTGTGAVGGGARMVMMKQMMKAANPIG